MPSFAAFDANGAAQASMGIAMGDVDGDGILDIFVTNFSEDFSTLYKGLGLDPHKELPGPQNRPLPLADYNLKPIGELF